MVGDDVIAASIWLSENTEVMQLKREYQLARAPPLKFSLYHTRGQRALHLWDDLFSMSRTDILGHARHLASSEELLDGYD